MARKEKKYHYIYKTTNLKNGKFYIGMHSTNDLNDGYLGSGTRLRRSIRRNGKENFKIEYLEFFDSRELLVEREKQLVNTDLLKNSNCMNLKQGGDGGFSLEATKNGRKKTDEFLESKYGSDFRKIISKNYYNNLTPEQRFNLTQKVIEGQRRVNFKHPSFFGKNHTEETKKKMSEAKKGKYNGSNNPQFGTMWITNGTENKKIKKQEIIPIGWKAGRIC
jgi:hypothetical protein